MKNFKNAGFSIEDVFGKKAVVILLSACTVKELDKFFVCSKMNPTDFSRLIENLRLYTTEETQGKVDELEKMYAVATESTTTADTTATTTTTTTTESTPAPTYTYRELQAQVKALKAAGLTNVKLNSKREVLEAAIAQAQVQAPAPAPTTTDTTPAPMPAPAEDTTTADTTEDTYHEISFSSKGMQAGIADLDEMYLEAVITKALGRPTKKLIADFELDPSLKRSEVKIILTDAITAMAAYYQDTMEDDEEPTESAPVEEAPAPVAEEAPAEEKAETTLEVVEVKEVTPVAPKSIIPEGYKWSYVKYNWDQFQTKEEAIDFALWDTTTMDMNFHDGAAIEEWMVAQVASCPTLATLQSRLRGAAWDMMVLYHGFHSSITDWLETHHCPVRDDARKDVNYMMSVIWKDVVLPDFKAAYPTAWAAVTEEA